MNSMGFGKKHFVEMQSGRRMEGKQAAALSVQHVNIH